MNNKKAYVLIYVIILLAFISSLAIYSIERLELSLLIEDNRYNKIKKKVELESQIKYLFEKENIKKIQSFIKKYVDSSLKGEKVDTNIILEDGKASGVLDFNKEKINWTFEDEEYKFEIEQSFYIPIEESNIIFDEKFNLMKNYLYTIFHYEYDEDVNIKWNNYHWTAYDNEDNLLFDFPDKDNMYLIINGNLNIKAPKAPSNRYINGIVLIQGDLILDNTTYQGIILQKGISSSERIQNLRGYYENKNSSDINIKYFHVPLQKYGVALEIENFIQTEISGMKPYSPDAFVE